MVYYPLYDRLTGLRTSFVFISAGLDGNIDYRLDSRDSLYLDDWWEKMKVYNLPEAIANQYFSRVKSPIFQAWIDTNDQATNLPSNLFSPDGLVPKFSLIDYWFGRKDYVVALDTIPIIRQIK